MLAALLEGRRRPRAGAREAAPRFRFRSRHFHFPPSRERVAEATSSFDGAEISCDGAGASPTKSREPAEVPRFARIVDDHGVAVLGFLRRLVGDWHTAQDLRQETLLRALTAMRRAGGPARERPWLFRIALRAAADFWRDRSNRRGAKVLEPGGEWEIDPGPGVPGLAAEREARAVARRRVESALERLAPLTRSVLEMRYLHGQSVGEIAELHRMSRVAVRVRLCRGRVCVRRLLAEDEENGKE